MFPVDTDDRPLVLVWEVTQACALSCEHCRADAQERRHPDELTTAEGTALLDDATRFADDQLVVLSGGDPLKRPDLVDLVDYGTDQGLQMTLTPSGTDELTSDVIADLDDAGLRRLAVSFDGATPERHDAFRGEPGSFESTVRAAKAARDRDVPLQVNSTVCADTVDDLPAIRDLVADLDAVLWSVFFLVPVGRGTALDPVSPARADRVMAWLDDVSQDEPFMVKTTEAPQYRRVQAQRSDGQRRSRGGGIRAGAGFAFVSHVGDVYPSGFLPAPAGNVRTDSVVDLYRESDLFQALRDPDGFGGKCGACPYREDCGGSRSRAYAVTGDPLASDPLCPFVPPDYDGPLPERQRSDEARP
jgi:MoaA/NifB/PqqE/SkfB family radical SAM enzyme